MGIFRIKDDGMQKLKTIIEKNPSFGNTFHPLDEVLFEHCEHALISYDNNFQYTVLNLME